MLPHVDELRPIHNLESMAELVRALSDAPAARHTIRRRGWQGRVCLILYD